MDVRGKTILGTFFHAPERGSIEILKDALVEVGEDGTIARVVLPNDPGYAGAKSEARNAGRLLAPDPDSFLLPGMVDLHIHAPQYPQLGTALHMPLEVWLQKYTFPLEARYADARFADRAYKALVGDLLALGTTTAVLFATIHRDATERLIDLCLENGLRAVIGRVAMDDPRTCPEDYRDSSAPISIEETAAIVDYIRKHSENSEGLVLPAITPRFIPACTDAALKGLGELAGICDCHVQTHCSESDWEHSEVLARYGRTDAAALDGFGLLTRKSVLAHSNFITSADMDLIRRRGAGIAHCPLSNAYFSNAVFPLRTALERGLRVGLGTDISGGPSASLLENCRVAVAASRMLEDGVDAAMPPDIRGKKDTRIDWKTAFHLATAGGADVLDLPVGSFGRGRKFDAILVDTVAANGTIRRFDELDDPESVLQKIVYTASKPNIVDVWVGGRRVAGASPQ